MEHFAKIALAGYLLVAVTSLGSSHALSQEVMPPDEQEEAVKPILPPSADESAVVKTDDTLDKLFEKLARDPQKASAGATARRIWQEWGDSGSASINLLMQWADRALVRNDYATALDLLDQVVVIAPDYAEGWNRRATLHFTKQDFGKSIADIEATLALEPRHFGALSGLAVIMQRAGKDEAALKTWYKVLEIYPANEQAQSSVIELEEKLTGKPI